MESLKPTIGTTLLLSVCLLVINLCGCNKEQLRLSKTGETLPKTMVSVDELQDRLDEFEEIFTSRIKSAAALIDNLSADPKIIKMTLLWRSRSIAALQNILEQPRPTVVLVDSWLLCIRLTNYIESGEAADIFGKFQPLALDTSKEILAQIENVARDVLSTDVYDQTASALKSIALANPIQSGFTRILIPSTQVKKDQPVLLDSVMRIPLAPVRALEGVDRTSSAIYDFSTTTRHLTDVIQELPESTRWQLMLALYDLEETDMAKSFLSSMQTIADSSTRLSAAIEQLPVVLADANQSQEEIRLTLQQVNETAEQLIKLFDAANQTAGAFSQTAIDVNTTAIGWGDAARATEAAVKQFKPQNAAAQTTESDDKPSFKETVEAVRDAANQIQTLSEQLPDRSEQIIAQLNSLSTRITIKVALLIILIFFLFVVSRFITKKAKRQ